MRVTKFTHSCLRVEGDGVLVVDPGAFSERSALTGADAVLITHEHIDHLDVDALADALAQRPQMRVHAHPDVLPKLDAVRDAVTVVAPGDAFQAAGFSVRAYGGQHAIIHPEIPRIANVGFLVGGQVFHPGDALTVPDEPVATLLVPMHAPWSKTAELIDYVRAVHADQAFAVHDGALNEIGLGMVTGLLGERGPGTPTPFSRLAPGDTVEL